MKKSAVMISMLGFAVAGLAAPADPPLVANSMRSATDVPVCTPFNCSSAIVSVTCIPNLCSAVPLPPAPCDNGSCRSENAVPATTGKG